MTAPLRLIGETDTRRDRRSPTTRSSTEIVRRGKCVNASGIVHALKRQRLVATVRYRQTAGPEASDGRYPGSGVEVIGIGERGIRAEGQPAPQHALAGTTERTDERFAAVQLCLHGSADDLDLDVELWVLAAQTGEEGLDLGPNLLMCHPRNEPHVDAELRETRVHAESETAGDPDPRRDSWSGVPSRGAGGTAGDLAPFATAPKPS